jgi:glutamate-1-semialdehyde 2,1-aminomutase
MFSSDLELWHGQLESFVPPKVFDAHVHLYEASHFSGPPPSVCALGPASVGWHEYKREIGAWMLGRELAGLCFGFPAVSVDFQAANAWIGSQCRRPEARGQMLIHPSMDADFIRQCAVSYGFVGLKPYHLFAADTPTWEAPIQSYLPEQHVRVADELGLSITLHIVRSRALADPANQEAIQGYSTRSPNARFVLAHAARGFNPHHALEGVHALRRLGNVWFDTSAVTDAGAIEAVARVFGHRRLLYGSDYPVSQLRGRCVAIGDSFLWLSSENTRLDAPYAQLQFTLVGLESLRTLKLAAQSLGWTDEQTEDVFLNNSLGLWG